MMMELHQIQLSYQAEEDRILCRTSFKGDDGGLQEVRAWLTRRMVKGLWPTILGAMERQVALDKPQAAHASSDIVGMEHHASIDAIRDSGSFDSPYDSEVATLPLGSTPILVTTVNFTMNVGEPIRMDFRPSEGSGVEIALPSQILHGFCSLLKDAVAKAEWDMDLSLPGSLAASGPKVLN